MQTLYAPQILAIGKSASDERTVEVLSHKASTIGGIPTFEVIERDTNGARIATAKFEGPNDPAGRNRAMAHADAIADMIGAILSTR